jgi:2',3'-cyclic-nucleotide 2'-phosphodiesterase (5'-nucleotidase family)
MTLVRQIRSEAEHVLLVDSGNVHYGLNQSSLMADTFRGEPDIEFMNELGYVAMGLGHHDLAYGWDILKQRRRDAFFPILCANLVHADSGQPTLDTHTVVEEGGIKIAFTSFAHPKLWEATLPSGMAVRDPIDTAQTLIPKLKKQADLVVVLGHQPLQGDYALANAVHKADIIIGGHERIPSTEAHQIGGTLIVDAYKWGAHLGRLDVAVSAKITSYRHRLIPLTPDVPADAGVEARVGTLQADMQQRYPDRFRPIGQAAVDISNEHAEFKEACLGNMVCDVVRQKTQADIALTASSQILNALFAGPLVVQDVRNALPYLNEIITLRLTGEQVQQVLDLSASASGTGNFFQVSGARFQIMGGVAIEVTIDGDLLDPNQTYLIAIPNRQLNQDRYRELLALGTDISETNLTIKEALIEYITLHSPVYAQKDGRILIVE